MDQNPDESDDDVEVLQDHEENVLEPWVDWIRRVTHNFEDTLERLKIRTWNEQARKRKWRFAAELHSGDGEQKWSRWNSQLHSDARRSNARRKPARPNSRWTDELQNFYKKRLLR